VTTPDSRKIARFLVPARRDGDVPAEIFIHFQGSDVEKVKKAYLNGVSRFHLERDMLSGEAELIGKPSSVFIDRGYLHLRFPSADVTIPLGDVSEELYDAINYSWLYIRVHRSGKYVNAREIRPLILRKKTEYGKELWEYCVQNDVGFSEIITIAYGYHPKDLDFNFLMMLRFLAAVKVAGVPFHYLELSPPNTGKTTFAVRNTFAFNWYYIDEAPSYANLIMNAKTNALGAVYRSDGIVIDEIDKYGNELQDAIQIMLTGMSHGLWTRAKGDRPPPKVVRWIPIVLFGNTSSQRFIDDIRNTMADILIANKMKESVVTPLLDRISLIVLVNKQLNASDLVSGYVIPDTILKSFADYISENTVLKEHEQCAEFQGRRKDQCNRLFSVLEWTYCREADCEKQPSSSLVKGILI